MHWHVPRVSSCICKMTLLQAGWSVVLPSWAVLGSKTDRTTTLRHTGHVTKRYVIYHSFWNHDTLAHRPRNYTLCDIPPIRFVFQVTQKALRSSLMVAGYCRNMWEPIRRIKEWYNQCILLVVSTTLSGVSLACPQQKCIMTVRYMNKLLILMLSVMLLNKTLWDTGCMHFMKLGRVSHADINF
jgi:hypothetical protein